MSQNWINRITYWVLATVPFGSVFLVDYLFGASWFIVFFILYFFLYRPVLDIRRLLQLGVVEEKDAWKLIVPFSIPARYTGLLWLG